MRLSCRSGALPLFLALAFAFCSAASAQTLIYLARHGETEGNRQGILQGQTNSPLSDAGRAQAARLAALMAEKGVQAIYASSLGRALETARRVSERTGVPVEPRDALRERSIGHLEGKKASDSNVDAELERLRDPTYRPPAGESFADLTERVGDFVAELLKENRDRRVLIVAHGGTNRAVLAHLLGLSTEETSALPAQPHGRVYVIYRLSRAATTLLWEEF